MKHSWFAAGIIAIFSTAGFAHQNVQNPVVQARMDNMTAMARQVEVLGNMARGLAPFNASAANDALDRLSGQANRIIDFFEEPATDPESAARAGVWDTFANFSSRAMGLELLSAELAGSVTDRGTLATALRRVGAQCSGCHEDYRINRE